MPMSVAQPDFAQPGELEVELWDGEEMVKGQPTPRHEALRAALLAQLFGQRRTYLSVEVSSAIEEPGMAPRPDGSVLDRSFDPPATLVGVAVGVANGHLDGCRSRAVVVQGHRRLGVPHWAP